MAVVQRILIADNDPETHRLLLAALESSGRLVESVHSGQDVLERVASVQYDLLLADTSMPDCDARVLDRVHELRPATKVVVLTGDCDPENVIRSIRGRAFAFFSKPLGVSAIADMATRALRSTPHHDDIEVISARPNWLELRLRCKLEAADRIVQFMRELAKDLPISERENIASAFREILVNAIEHGCRSDPDKCVSITYVRTARAVVFYVRDPGPGFSFEELSHAAVSNPADAPFEHSDIRDRLGMRPGGFGILLARNMVDELIYNEAGNEALLIKYLK
jgi:CheY-like chemotaxis protein